MRKIISINKCSNNRGITLIALIITIIVMLILAGVTISLTLGENGLFTTAQKAAKNYVNAQEKELAEINNFSNTVDKTIEELVNGENIIEPSVNLTVTFDANGGTTPEESKVVMSNTTYGELPVPTREGYTFKGWFTEVSDGTLITETTIVGVRADQTLYAQWDANKYTLTFDANGGTSSETSRAVAFESAYGELPIPTRGDYIFQGWFTTVDGDEQISENTKMGLGDVTVFAQWKINCTGEYNAHTHVSGCYKLVRIKACTGVLNAHDHTSSCGSSGCAGTVNAHNCERAGEMQKQLKCGNLPLNAHEHLPECIY